MCKEGAPDSATQVAQSQPAPLPPPTFEAIYAGAEQVTLDGLANGARFTVSRNGASIGTYHTWGGRTLLTISPPAVAADSFSATQVLCPGVGPSAPWTITVLPCSALPAPTVGAIQDGDASITVLTFTVGARIRVYINGVKVGDGGGPVVALTSAVADGDVIVVRQSVGSCDGKTAQQVMSRCVDPPIGADPSALDLFPVGNTEYDGGQITLHGQSFSVKGTVYYPAEADGSATPFNVRLGKLGPSPIVFLAHGNHSPSSPSHLGYDYFQAQLARMGIVACSVFLNETNGDGGGTGNILDRADLIIAGIKQMQSLSAGADAIFGGRLDFSRVGLMGHSRGGDAVVQVPTRITLLGVTIQAVLALAPTNFFGAASPKPSGYAFMTLLPAADGDVVDNDGAVFYDTATPSPLKAELYVFNANHNYFNRQWLNNDNSGGLPTMARSDHERILSAYGCAFYRAMLLKHDTTAYLTGRLLPAGVMTANVHLAFARDSALVVDGHDTGTWVPANSMGQTTTQTAGLAGSEFAFAQSAAAFNGSFFGRSVGMVAQAKRGGGTYRSPLSTRLNLTNRQIWVRVAELFTGSIPSTATGFQLGLEDSTGAVAWVDSDEMGGVTRPFDRTAYDSLTKTMPLTLRFNTHCFKPVRGRLNLKQIQALLLRLNRPKPVPLAFEDLQIQAI